jgi:hypothetical protein
VGIRMFLYIAFLLPLSHDSFSWALAQFPIVRLNGSYVR